MIDPASEMEWQLRKLMEIAAGEPARQITMQTVRRLARRRTITAVAAALAIVLIGGAGAAVAARTAGQPQVTGAGLPSGVPRYYYENAYTNSASRMVSVIRATASGAITATVRCPAHGGPMTISSVVPVGSHTFFMLCQHTASRIFGFRLTRSGRIGAYFTVRGGMLSAANAYGLVASPRSCRSPWTTSTTS